MDNSDRPDVADEDLIADEEEGRWTFTLLAGIAGVHTALVWLIWLATGSGIVAAFTVAVLLMIESSVTQGWLGF